ncbi:MAG: recombinase family protein [Defluviitaleaceae bacterium]|nr:recombinase family protein [Defluviitaleaceae bacterium]
MKQRDITAAIYLRLSRDDGSDAESNSIGNQREILNRYASEHGFIVRKEYVDDGWSGTNFERPQFKKMIKDIEVGDIGIVLIKDLSRLGRNNAMIAFYTEIFLPDHDVRLIAPGDSIDTGHGDNEIMPFKSVINEYYARDISRKIRSAKRNQALKGEFIGAHAPYGYIKDPNNKHKLIVDDEAATVVRRMFEIADNGIGTHQIACILSYDKILIPTMYKYNVLGYKSNKLHEDYHFNWCATTVRTILESRVYVGDIVGHVQGKKSFKNQKLIRYPESEWIVVEDMHEALVDMDLFERVQKLIKVKKRANAKGITNIFSGVLKCADCGSNLTFRSYKGLTGYNSGSYLCNKYRHGSKSENQRKTCTAHYLPYIGVYDATITRLNKIISANATEEEILRQLTSEKESQMVLHKKAFDNLKRRNSELDRIIQKIVEQNALGEITKETFTKLYTRYIEEQNELAGEMKTFEAKFAAENLDKEKAGLIENQIRKYEIFDELSREKALDFIDRIVVHEPSGNHKDGNRRQKIEFHYRFIGRLPDSECSL